MLDERRQDHPAQARPVESGHADRHQQRWDPGYSHGRDTEERELAITAATKNVFVSVEPLARAECSSRSAALCSPSPWTYPGMRCMHSESGTCRSWQV